MQRLIGLGVGLAIAVVLLSGCAGSGAWTPIAPAAPLPTMPVLLASPTVRAAETPLPAGADGVALALTADAYQAQAAQAQAQANAQAAQAQQAQQAVLAVTAQAQQTRDAYAVAMQVTADSLQVQQAQIALAQTASAATATQRAADLAAAQAASQATATQRAVEFAAGEQARQAGLEATREAGDVKRQEAQAGAMATVWGLMPFVALGLAAALAVVIVIFVHNMLTVWSWRRTVIDTTLGPAVVTATGARLLPSPDEVVDVDVEPDWGGDGKPVPPAAVREPPRVNGEARPDLGPQRDEREWAAREACVEFLTSVMRLTGRKGTTIPSNVKMREAGIQITAETWQARVNLLRAYIVSGNQGTRIAGEFGSVFELRAACGDGRAVMTLPPLPPNRAAENQIAFG